MTDRDDDDLESDLEEAEAAAQEGLHERDSDEGGVGLAELDEREGGDEKQHSYGREGTTVASSALGGGLDEGDRTGRRQGDEQGEGEGGETPRMEFNVMSFQGDDDDDDGDHVGGVDSASLSASSEVLRNVSFYFLLLLFVLLDAVCLY